MDSLEGRSADLRAVGESGAGRAPTGASVALGTGAGVAFARR